MATPMTTTSCLEAIPQSKFPPLPPVLETPPHHPVPRENENVLRLSFIFVTRV